MSDLDPRLYGIAPKEFDAIGDTVYLTMVGVMKRLNISESTLRRNEGLMKLRKVLGPNTYRWHPKDVDAYVASLDTTPKLSRLEKIKRTQKLGEGTIRSRKAYRHVAAAPLKAMMAEKLNAYHTSGGDRDPG
jgi:hypothetical protein